MQTKSVLRMVRVNLIGEEFNVGLSNVSAVYFTGKGNLFADTSLILYEIKDSDYRDHYALFFSLSEMEAQMNLNGTKNTLKDRSQKGCFSITTSELTEQVLLLVEEFFGKTYSLNDVGTNSYIFKAIYEDQSLADFTPYKSVSDKNGDEYYFFYVRI